MHKFLTLIFCACLFTGASCQSTTPSIPTPPTDVANQGKAVPANFSPYELEEFSFIIPRAWTLDESQKNINHTIHLFEAATATSTPQRSISFTTFPLPDARPTLGDLMATAQKELVGAGVHNLHSDIVHTNSAEMLSTTFEIPYNTTLYYTSQHTLIGTNHLLLITDTSTNMQTRAAYPSPDIISFLQIK